MEKVSITVVNGDDWEGMFLNDMIHTQGHEVELSDIAEVVNGDFRLVNMSIKYLNSKGIGWLEERGCFPDFLEDIPTEFFESV